MTHLANLAARQLWRERRTSELRILAIALLIAVCTTTAIASFGQRIQGAMQLRAAEFLAADLVLQGSSPASEAQIQSGLQAGLQHARTVEFPSVISGEHGIQLSSIKAVEAPYPLRGELRSRAGPEGVDSAGGIPAPGEAWAEARLLAALQLAPGDSIEVGYQQLKLTRVISHEPDRSGNFYSLMPRVMINLADLDATGVIQPGSRVRYRELWRGEAAALARYRNGLKDSLEPNQRLLDTSDGNQQLGDTLERATRYINLASLVAVLLSGVAVAMATARFTERRLDMGALLRCFGLARRHTLQLFLLQLLLLGLLACLGGALLGWLAQFGLFALLAGLLPSELPPAGWQPAAAGIAVGLVALAGFALPPLVSLGRVPPLRVLRRDLQPVALTRLASYGCALLAMLLVMWWLSLDLKLTLALLGGGILGALLLGGLWLAGLRLLRRLLADAGPAWRLGLGQLLRYPLAAVGQTLAFGLILLAMSLILLMRSELLADWQKQLPEDAPNHFALNILPDELDAFRQALARLDVEVPALYPVLPGRLLTHNGEDLKPVPHSNDRASRALRRDLNLTWTDQLPADNRITAGHWWPDAAASALPRVSVEEKVAASLGLKLGDRIGFNLGGQQVEAEVSSLRSVDWNSFHPNFFMIFEPAAMQDMPAGWMTSFYLPPERTLATVELTRQFPTLTLLPVDALLEQIRSIIAQVSLAVEYVLLFVLAAGLSVLFAGLQATLDERTRQGALLRALGARRQLLVSARLREFGLIGLAAGLLAAIGSELVLALLYQLVLKLPVSLHPQVLLLPVFGALLIGSAGLLATRRVLHSSPLSVLREG